MCQEQPKFCWHHKFSSKARFQNRDASRRAFQATLSSGTVEDGLYISLGKPREAVGIDIGNGVIVRYDEAKGEVVGITVLGLRDRLERFLQEKGKD